MIAMKVFRSAIIYNIVCIYGHVRKP